MDGLTRLAEYVAKLEGTQKAFADAVGCSESHLSLILAGQRGVSWGLALRIERATGIPAPSLMREPERARA